MMEPEVSSDLVLNEIFELNHFLGNNLENPKETVDQLINLFGQFSLLSQKEGSLVHLSDIDASNLELISSILTNTKEGFFVKWFPDYGCVLLVVKQIDDMNQAVSSLELIGLDKW
jgi:hypothetical protein